MHVPARPVRIVLLLALLVPTILLFPVAPVVAVETAPETRSATVDGVEAMLPPATEDASPAGTEDGDENGEQAQAATVGPADETEPERESARTTDPIEAPIPFVGLGLSGTGDEPEVRIRTLDRDGQWSAWVDVELMDPYDGPDPESAEAGQSDGDDGWWSDAIWAGESTHVQLEIAGADPDSIDVTFTDTAGLSETATQRLTRWFRSLQPAQQAEASTVPAGAPDIKTRADWGANENWRSGTPTEREVKHGVLHHTATKNDYTREEAPQQIRNMYHWHTVGNNGWNDLGYNFVIDRFGTIWEGRYGGVEKGIQGAHAGGWNSGSFGVALMGNFNSATPQVEALESIADLFAWKYAIHGLDPDPDARVWQNNASIRTLEGHRNVRSQYIEWSTSDSFRTDCPGERLHWQTSTLRNSIAERFEKRFEDVDRDHPFHDEIAWMATAGYASGYQDGTFRPAERVSRMAMVTFLYRLAGEPDGPHDDPGFTDVGDDHPFRDEIAWATHTGIASGYPDDTFRPAAKVSRMATTAFMYRLAREPDGPHDDPGFTDVDDDHPFRDEIAWATDTGIASGYQDDTFRPGRTVSRQAMSAFLYRLQAELGP